MSTRPDTTPLDTCGCCDADAPEPAHANPPGLGALRYRIGTQPEILARMLARIHAWEVPDGDHAGARPLDALATRDASDAAIALLDAWAVAGDVLTFYTERVANEGFLRTATERLSILELARSIGYELRPGVAAETYVAFIVDEAEGGPLRADVPAGTQVQSIPQADGERPQTFETTDALTAERAWNALTPRLSHPPSVTATMTHVWLDGVSTGLDVGARVLLIVDSVPTARRVVGVEADTAAQRTRVVFAEPLVAPATALPAYAAGVFDPGADVLALTEANVRAHVVERTWAEAELQAFLTYHAWDTDALLRFVDALRADALAGGPDAVVALRRRAAVFGHNAADWYALSKTARADYYGLADADSLPLVDTGDWPHYVIFAPKPEIGGLVLEVQQALEVTPQMVAEAVTAAAGAASGQAFGTATATGGAVAALAAQLAGDAAGLAHDVGGAVENLVTGVGNQVVARVQGIVGGLAAMTTDVQAKVDSAVEKAGELAEKAADAGSGLYGAITAAWSAFTDPSDQERIAAAAEAIADVLKTDADLESALYAIVQAAADQAGTDLGMLEEDALDLADRLRESALPSLNRLLTLQETVGDFAGAAVSALGGGARATGAAVAAGIVSAAVNAALQPPPGRPPPTRASVEATARLFADAAVELLRAQEGATPALSAALDSDIGQRLPDLFAQAETVLQTTLLSEGATALLGTAEGYVDLVEAPRAGAEAVRSLVLQALDQAAFGLVANVSTRPFPARYTNRIDLDATYPKVQAGDHVLLAKPGAEEVALVDAAVEAARAEYGLSGKTTRLTLSGANLGLFEENVRDTTVHVENEALALAPVPLDAPLAVGQTALWLDTMAVGLRVGQPVALTGEEVGTASLVRREVVVLKEVLHRAGYTRLTFEHGLQYGYVRATVTLNANVARANHGETVAGEALGSGDGAQPHQRFTLKKPPLTHTTAATPSGAASTLEVRVDGVAWRQVDALYPLGPRDRAFVVRLDDDQHAHVRFGDGHRGARLPTGQENVVATYRSGIGQVGEVAAGSLTLLKTRPYGVRGVTNPVPATGAQDPEALADARQNAPLTVLTLDRVVSLRDYEDFARAFAGIGKAQAAAVWDGRAERLHLTIADASGDAVVDPLYTNLVDALEAARDPLRTVTVASFQPLAFSLAAKVLVDDAYEWDAVRAALEAVLSDAFAFEARGFGQPVTAAEVVAAMHGVEGVVAVDLDALALTPPDASVPTTLDDVLVAARARYDAATDALLPAQLLTLHAFGLTLTPMS